MKVRRKKLLAVMICAALSLTDILPVGFSVSASELEQPDLTTVSGEETANSQEKNVPESENGIDDVYFSEDDATEELEIGTKIEEKESETQKEEGDEKDTEDETEVQQESSEMEKSTESEIESETEEPNTELENKADSPKAIEKDDLKGVYQFGDSPADSNGSSTYSTNLFADTNISQLEDYLYHQMKTKNETIDVERFQISTEEMGDIVAGVLNENPDLYFVIRNYHFSHYEEDILTIEVRLTYDNSLDDNAFQRATKEALSVVKSEMSDLEKAIALHDYLALNCEYDEENYEAGTIPDISYSAYGALVNRKAVCQGYALAYKYLLNQIGINCYMVISKEMQHGWNLIELNGTYYQVDVTWDDPSWDLIGRVRHEHMFRSDYDFVNECKHHDWFVTKGSEVVNYKAVDTTYDTAFWLDCDSPLVLEDEDCYYVTFNEQKNAGVINKASLSDSDQKGTEICEIGEWTVWGNDSGCYTGAYSGLFRANNRLYFNDKTSIYSIDLRNIENETNKRTEFTADITAGYIYGIAFRCGKVLYSLRQKPNISSKDIVLTADITVEIEEPSEIPVEKIELDKETLTLTVGSTTKLENTITPSDAANSAVAWASSDDTIAKVENGIVTAVAVGSCTITASVDGIEEACDVIVRASGEDIASGSYLNITWVIDSDGKLTVTGTGDFASPIVDKYKEYNRAPWYDYKDSIISAQIDVSEMTDASYMFNSCYNLTSVDIKEFDTQNVTDMTGMFSGCGNLISLDLSNFNTENVTNMTEMFSDCGNLISLDLSNFNTQNVTDMSAMFYFCFSLSNLDVSGFKTDNVTDMSAMFQECESLTSIDVSSFDTSNVTNMEYMFVDCWSLETLDVSGFDTSNVTNMEYMFVDCWSLKVLDASSFDTSKVASMSYMFGECSKLTYLDISSFNLRNFEDEDEEIEKNVDGLLDGCINLTTIHTPCNLIQSISLPKTEAGDIWYQPDGTQITELPQNLGYSIIIAKNNVPTISEPYITVEKDQTYYECGDILNLYDLKVMYHNIDGTVQEVYDYSTNKDEIDMSTTGIKTLKITYNGLEAAVTLNLKPKTSIASGSYGGITWNINEKGKLIVQGTGDFAEPTMEDDYSVNENRAPWLVYKDSIKSAEVYVTGMTDSSYMFDGCLNLKNIELRGMDTGSITNMRCMFRRCESLENINMSKFNTANVTTMGGMFYRCLELKNIDVSSFDTSKVTSMGSMFGECWSLETLDVSGFDTSKVTNMGNMFWACWSLKVLDVSGFDTGNVTNMYHMFIDCTGLKSLDMSGFDASKVTDSSNMLSGMPFNDCGVTAIYTPCNLKDSIRLPSGDWYQPDGTVITELPKNLPYSILITKNIIPTVSTPHILANKIKTVYTCGDTLNTDDLTVRFYNTDGTVKAVTDYTTNADAIDMSTAGTKTLIITYNNLTTEVELTVTVAQHEKVYTITFDLCGYGEEIAPVTGITAGSLIAEPQSPQAEGYRFMGWYKDSGYTYKWNFNEDTVQENITLYAFWVKTEDTTEIGSLFIQKIPTQTYTGSALKPTVTVYYQSNGKKTLLKAGTDYTLKYYNNIESDTEQEKTLGGISQTDTGNGFTKDLAYIVITCKGNYTGSVYQNFHINPASIAGDEQNLAKGFTLKYTEQFANSTKSLKPFSSLKYKKAMKSGTDYNVTLTVKKAYDANGNALTEGSAIDENSVIPSIPAGYQGTFLMTITGINNYEGTITKTIYVADKNHLIKNVSVSLGKNQKKMKYTGDAVTLTPAWYDASTKKYYIIKDGDKYIEADKNNVFTIKLGTEYLLYGRDFTVSYETNKAVGTATMIIRGIGDYAGTKNVTFRITGIAFNARNIRVSNLSASFIYTGGAHTQNDVVLTDISGTKSKELVCGTDYTIDYKNNIKKGTATMIFTANPVSGYSGSFKQTFKITPAGLNEITDVTAIDLYNDTIITENGTMRFEGKVLYAKGGAKLSNRIVLTNRNTNSILIEGTDYTISYSNNKAVTTGSSLASMTIKGKGNYAGTIAINFPIIRASLSESENLTATTSAIAYNAEKADDYQYRPQIKLMDQKTVLSASKDYEIMEYKNCSQSAVKAYLEALINGTATADKRPYAIIKAREESGYYGELEVDLSIYQIKVTAKNLYIIVSEETEQVAYTGKQVKPEVTVYYGGAEAVQQAKNAGETKEDILTDTSGSYKLTKLKPKENGMGDYTLVYGANITAGKSKGSVTVNGTGLYGGKVTVKFTILGKDVYSKTE